MGNKDLEDRIVKFTMEDGNYLLRVFDSRSGDEIVNESIILSQNDITHTLTHIPEQQMSIFKKYLHHPATAGLLLVGGAYTAHESPGPAGLGVFFLTMLATLVILANDTRLSYKECEFNEALSRYGFPTLKLSKYAFGDQERKLDGLL